MPELPEVETMVRGIRPHAESRTVLRFEFCRCSRKPLTALPSRQAICRRTAGTTIDRIQRRAKRIVFCLSSGERLVFEPRMTGLMLLSGPPTTQHLRVRIHLKPLSGFSSEVLFWDRRGLGTVAIYSSSEFQQLNQRLGIDALDLTTKQLRERLQGTQREVKVALLDQSLIGGIGNLYASEILYLAGISPFCRSAALTEFEIEALHKAIRRVLLTAIRCEGSTLSDGTYRNVLSQDGSYQNHHRVYQRTDRPCPRCRRGTIRRAVQAQRATFFCDHCQITKGPQ